MPAQRMQTWKKRSILGACLAVFLGWIVWICVAITNEPAEGADSLTALRDDARTAVQGEDAEHLQRLFDEDSVADDYAETFIDRLKDADALNADLVLEKREKTSYLVVKGNNRDGAAVCTPWMVTTKDSRWYLDGTPPTAGDLCQ